jgi:hypothetical protein
VKSHEQILATLDTASKNRGLLFDAELVPYCGKVFRVRTKIERFVDEKTGVMRMMKTPAFILDGVWCRSQYSNKKMFCPRSIYSWWREIWLERVDEAPLSTEETGLLMPCALAGPGLLSPSETTAAQQPAASLGADQKA